MSASTSSSPPGPGRASRGIVEARKCAELRWCPLDGLPDPVVPHELAVLEDDPVGYQPRVHDLRLPEFTGGALSDDSPTQTGDLGPLPDATIEPKEPNPGGADALPPDVTSEPADLDPDSNPAVDEHETDGALEEMKEGEDTSTEATEGGSDDVPPEEESPA